MHSKTDVNTDRGPTHGSVYILEWLPEFTDVFPRSLVHMVRVYRPKVWPA